MAGEEARFVAGAPPRQRAGEGVGDAAHAVLAIGKKVGQFARHGDGMQQRCLRQGVEHDGHGGFEVLQAQPQRRRQLAHSPQLAAGAMRGLEVGAADVPADGITHGSPPS